MGTNTSSLYLARVTLILSHLPLGWSEFISLVLSLPSCVTRKLPESVWYRILPNFLGSLGQNLFGGIATFVYGKKQKRNQCGPFGTQPPSVFKSQGDGVLDV